MKFGSCFINIDLIVVLTSVIQSYQRWQRSQRVQIVISQSDIVSLWFLMAKDPLSVLAVETINKRHCFLLTWWSPIGTPIFKSHPYLVQPWAWNVSKKKLTLLSGLHNSIFLHTVSELILLAKVVDGPRNTEGVHFWQRFPICNVGGHRTQGFQLNWKQWNVI